MGEPYRRRKGLKEIIEYKNGKRTIYIMAMPSLWQIIKEWRPDKYEEMASQLPKKRRKEIEQKFVEHIITELSDEDKINQKKEIDRIRKRGYTNAP